MQIEPMKPMKATVRPPGSKSITNRALICAAMAEGPSTIRGVLDSEDTQVMISALQELGVKIRTDDSRTVINVQGCAGHLACERADLFVANSGTTMRFLAAMLAACHGEFRLDGVPRMRERPIDHLLDALRDLGGRITCDAGNGCPPISISADGLTGGSTTIRGDVSSQFLSGILMAAPYANDDVAISVDGPLVSKPYVSITTQVMRDFGIDAQNSESQEFHVKAPRHYCGSDYAVEPDASAASYFWAAAAITGGSISVRGLGTDAIQGDVAFCDCLERMGCTVERASNQIAVTGRARHGIDVNMNGISDTVQTLAAVALFVDSPTRIRGVAHIRHKETDRIGDLACELRKLGATVVELDDGLEITPAPLHGTDIATYNDHRMAMSLALVGLRVEGVTILNPECTVKTYPEFFRDLESLRRR